MDREAGRAVVVGAGIAGLAATASLRMHGWDVTVLEQAEDLRPVGAGLAVTANGMAALGCIGADEAVWGLGHPVHVAGMRSWTGRWLIRLPDPDGAALTACGVHRARLHGALWNAAGHDGVITGARVKSVDPGDTSGARAEVHWQSGHATEATEADLVVAADGLNSAVRSCLFPGHDPVHSGYTSWRAVVEDTRVVDERFVAWWGPHAEFGAVRISDTRVYWYGYVRCPPGRVFPDELEAARARFAAWAPPVRKVIDLTAPEQLIRHDVWHMRRPLLSYVLGRTVLVGDAAHAMLPTMGQGANSSLEDAVGLGPLLRPGTGLAEGLAAFDRARRPRTQHLARSSRATARIGAHLGAGAVSAIRDRVLPLVPAAVLARAARTTAQSHLSDH